MGERPNDYKSVLYVIARVLIVWYAQNNTNTKYRYSNTEHKVMSMCIFMFRRWAHQSGKEMSILKTVCIFSQLEQVQVPDSSPESVVLL